MTDAPKIPDYADIQRLENLAWSIGTDLRKYGAMYHQLATQYGEDVLINAIEQYNHGTRW